jgi:Lon protease-like protein
MRLKEKTFSAVGTGMEKVGVVRQGDKFYSIKRHVQRRLRVVTVHTSGFRRKLSDAFYTNQTHRLKFKQNN